MYQLSEVFNSIGIEGHLVSLLFLLPIVITIIAISRYIVGIKSLGVYAPVVMTFMFYEFGYDLITMQSDPLKGLRYGLTITVVIVLATFVAYLTIKNSTLHYYSKLAMVQTSVAIAIILLLFIASIFNKNGLLQINIFSLILIATLTERFMHIFAFNKSIKSASLLLGETFLVATLAYLVISWPIVVGLLFKYPLMIILLFPINLIIGKFTGLRIREYFRFKNILDTDE